MIIFIVIRKKRFCWKI